MTGFVAIGVMHVDCFVAEIDEDVEIEFRNYDSTYFDGVDPDDILEDEKGRKYFVLKNYGWNAPDLSD